MDYNKINKCIKNAIKRIEPKAFRMSLYSYINYFSKRYSLTVEENLYIRKSIEKYIKQNENKLFSCDFTINGLPA